MSTPDQRVPDAPPVPGSERSLPDGPAEGRAGGDGGGGQGGGGDDDGGQDSLVPQVTLPTGGGAIRGIGEKFQANAFTGTGGMTIPVALSPARALTPELTVSYDSGTGNGPFGLGWRPSVPSVRRKTDKGLPRYLDEEESDVFVLSDAEDLVPVVDANGVRVPSRDEGTHDAHPYRPRVEGGFARIERWVDKATGASHWRVTSRDNVLSIFGRSETAQVHDPQHPERIFQWRLEQSEDDRGNFVVYAYKREDTEGVDLSALHEKERFFGGTEQAQTYLKRIRYGNRDQGATDSPPTDFMFEVVLDYGEHGSSPGPEQFDLTPVEIPTQPWPHRDDAFSSFRSGFDIRTRRLCQRILVFHHFSQEELGDVGPRPRLVRSTDFSYTPGRSVTLLTSVTQRGYVWSGTGTVYDATPFPAVDMEYVPRAVAQDVQRVDAAELEDMPAGAGGTRIRFADLEGEGIPGLLKQERGAFFFKRAAGDATFDPTRALDTTPSIAAPAAPSQRFLDLDGDGRRSLVEFSRSATGFYDRDPFDEDWTRFQPLAEIANIDIDQPDVQFVDLDGDGLPDILLHEPHRFTWWRSKGRRGWGDPTVVSKADGDEKAGPQLVFVDQQRLILFADMTGDGLSDVVRVRNGEICYWPNLGYGRFGRKITMNHAPVFDTPDGFSAGRVRVLDLDGSGPADLVYLGAKGARVWFSEAGNGFSDPIALDRFPRFDSVSFADAVDLLGKGTATLAWSSPLPSVQGRQISFIDLMAAGKPYLLQRVANNMGLETKVTYVSSTKFYLEDRKAGTPWITKLPFPVQVVEKVEVVDHVAKRRFANTYRYRHGYFDGPEREFRGFGMVEQRDTESFEEFRDATELAFADEDELAPGVQLETGHQLVDESLHVPPVRTKTWFHTGAYLGLSQISTQFAGEYFDGDDDAVLLPDTVVPGELTGIETREAVRALRGRTLRQEVYAQDGTALEGNPYTVSEANFAIETVQRQAGQRHASFFVHEREALSYQYERDPTDPRVSQSAVLEVDDFGNVLRSIQVGYPRRTSVGEDPQDQTKIVYTEADFVNQATELGFFRVGTPTESRSFEIRGSGSEGDPNDPFTLEDLDGPMGLVTTSTEVDFDAAPGAGVERRLLSKSRNIYYDDDANLALPFGQVGQRALPFQTRQMAFTESQISTVFGTKVPNQAALLGTEGGYFNDEQAWWVVSGRQVFEPAQFYLPTEVIDPFGNATSITFDGNDLLVASVEDPLQNSVAAAYDYRVLQPHQVTDPNGNVSLAAFDGRGLVVKTAILGKGEGDNLADPTTELEYDLFAFANGTGPVFVHTRAKKQHNEAEVQESRTYTDGGGNVIMEKVQAEPGVALVVVDGEVQEVDTSPNVRWVGTGRTIVGNKGNPIKQYEPFFATGPEFEPEDALGMIGVTPLLHYDPLGRNIRTDLPDGTVARVEFDGWSTKTFDPNDNVAGSGWEEARDGLPTSNPEGYALSITTPHADTPTETVLDSLGRVFLTVEHLKDAANADVFLRTTQELDIQGDVLRIEDAGGKEAQTSVYGMLGQALETASPDTGGRFALAAVDGTPLRGWDARGFVRRAEFDALRRVTHSYVTFPAGLGGGEKLVSQVVFGEAHPQVDTLNLRGQPFRMYDGAGRATNEEFDFKGNLVRASRRLNRDFTATPDWDTAVGAFPMSGGELDLAGEETAVSGALETKSYTTETTYDALNRIETATTPDASVTHVTYNEASLLEKVEVQIRGEEDAGNPVLTPFVTGVDYNARGQRLKIEYGNTAVTDYTYDPDTFRLTRLTTTRPGTDPLLQDLQYAYDPVGNIAEIRDDAKQTIYFANDVVEPKQQFMYDALYRLVEATGREHVHETGGGGGPQRDSRQLPSQAVPHSNDPNAVRRYLQEYLYDEVGNIQQMIHTAPSEMGTQTPSGNFTRHYAYFTGTNRLRATTIPTDDPMDDPSLWTNQYPHDVHGNMTDMPHLGSPGADAITYDHGDRLQVVDLGGGGTLYAQYDAGGQRVRKVRVNDTGMQIYEERVYLGAFEIYRERPFDNDEADPDSVATLQRETLHVFDDTDRIAMVETETTAMTVVSKQRYQLGNHLGSAAVELDDGAKVISYEEYHPFGTTSFRSFDSGSEVSAKRYRYIGKERDVGSGLYYIGQRYYAPWLGRWTRPDPAGLVDGPGRYSYSRNNPVRLSDPGGTRAGPLGESDITFDEPTRVEGELPRAPDGPTSSGVAGEGSSGSTSGDPELKPKAPPVEEDPEVRRIKEGSERLQASIAADEERRSQKVISARFGTTTIGELEDPRFRGARVREAKQAARIEGIKLEVALLSLIEAGIALAGGLTAVEARAALTAASTRTVPAGNALRIEREFSGPAVLRTAEARTVAAGGGAAQLRQSVQALRNLGVDKASRRAFFEGKIVAGETKDVISFVQVQGDELTVGIFQILKGANGPREFLVLQKNAVELARSLGLKNVRVGGAAFTNKALKQKLLDRGFELGSVNAPPPFTGDTIEFVSKVIPVK